MALQMAQDAVISRLLQRFILIIYRLVKFTGILETKLGRLIFEAVYGLYKSNFEAGSVYSLRDYIKPDAVVIDVGANIGFFTVKFATWVTGNGRVIALEPEPVNFAALKRTVQRANLESKVELINAAADNRTGKARLAINPIHPGDHKLAAEGILIKVISIDDLVRNCNSSNVGFIKIDVQGAESRVLEGASETIKRHHPSMYIEIDDAGLKNFGSSSETLLKLLKEYGYSFHVITKGAVSPPLTVNEVVCAVAGKGYMDILVLFE